MLYVESHKYTQNVVLHVVDLLGERGLFVRRASGVVRRAGARDVFLFNSAVMNMGIAITWMLVMGPAFYPGVDIILGTLFMAFLTFFQVMAYYFLCITMPRSGGEYVYISRSLTPLLGFLLSFNIIFWNGFYYVGVSAAFGSYMGVSAFLDSFGRSVGNPTLIQIAQFASWKPWGWFVIGTLFIVVFTIIIASGLRKYFVFQTIVNVLGYICIGIIVWLLISSSREAFIQAFNAGLAKDIGVTYQEIISLATQNGWSNPGFNLKNTLLFSIWPSYSLLWAYMSVSFGGEIKNVERNSFLGMLLMWAAAVVMLCVLSLLALRTIGYDFLGAISYNYYTVPQYSTPILPWLGYLALILTNNPILIFLVGIGYMFWSSLWVITDNMYGSRSILAWGIDRVLPDWFAKVDEKRRTPTAAHFTVLVGGMLFLALLSFSPWLGIQSGSLASCFTFIAIGVSAMILPWTNKAIYEASPASRFKVGSIPLMSIMGLCCTITMSITTIIYILDPVAGSSTPDSITAMILVFVAAIALFYGAKYIRKRQGIDLGLLFKEVPVE
jgi:amino acid transporter